MQDLIQQLEDGRGGLGNHEMPASIASTRCGALSINAKTKY